MEPNAIFFLPGSNRAQGKFLTPLISSGDSWGAPSFKKSSVIAAEGADPQQVSPLSPPPWGFYVFLKDHHNPAACALPFLRLCHDPAACFVS